MKNSTIDYDTHGREQLLALVRQSTTFRVTSTYVPDAHAEGIRSIGFRIQVPAQGPNFLLFTGHMQLAADDSLYLSGNESGWSSPTLMDPALYMEPLTILSPKLMDALTDDLVGRLDGDQEPAVSAEAFAEVFGD
ncbi:hypothetical protein [Paraburkholderia sp. J12]|uniref:hypothetical protein n=1 Tax=Paraburkholderia sp. J12 TaxID=2805432 RepID=UPI002ABE8258|nr:hypothetical protein [Paraburkholderia sp. J12]